MWFAASRMESDMTAPFVSRRTVLQGIVGVAAASVSRIGAAQAKFKEFPFSLGVAAGDPAPDGFVLWTRLAPMPLKARGGMSRKPIPVRFDIATDPQMTAIVRTGTATSHIETAHALHVEVDGLEPGRDYFYRFRAGDADSAVGRARTLPAPNAAVDRIKFASAGCQQWEGGYYTAWRHIADENLDFVIHYGDYIYEGAHRAADGNNKPLPRTLPEDFKACITLTDYRRRYGLYKSDPDLQTAHASCPFYSSYDDHEVANNWAGDTDARNTPPEDFLFRRAAAFQAWYEHMPVRRGLMPRGPDLRSYRAVRIGKLADIAILDTRQFRTKQPCGDGIKPSCPEAEISTRTMMGTPQEHWLADHLKHATGMWQVLAQQVMFGRLNWRAFLKHGEAIAHAENMDKWDSAPAARERILAMYAANKKMPVVLSGDAHKAFAMEIEREKPRRSPAGVEFLATSISSGGDGAIDAPSTQPLYADNPHLKFFANLRGYTRHTVSAKEWRADHRALESIAKPGAAITTLKSLAVEPHIAKLNEA
jgi:alkaline phosphatase D